MQLYWQAYNGDTTQTIYQGDALEVLRSLPSESVHCCITSPPYFGLRDYGIDGQIGLEETPDAYVQRLVEVFREVRRVLRDDGTLWLNLGDSYAGSGKGPAGNLGKKHNERHMEHTNSSGNIPNGLKAKDLIGIPWKVAFALQADGWYLRQDIIWHKPNPMPESVTDRCTKSHEYIFLLSKSAKYYYDSDAIREPLAASTQNDPRMQDMGRTYNGKGRGAYGEIGKANGSMEAWTLNPNGRNKRSVWTVSTKPFPEAHFAVYPPDLIEPCILAGTSPMACPHCGAPWKRVVEREPMEIKRSGRDAALGKYGKTAASGTMIKPATSVTIGWQPTCTCEGNDGSGRCVVLDPFVGSGTTLLVAQRLGRSGIGIELNPDYCAMASRRIDREQWSGSRRDDAGR